MDSQCKMCQTETSSRCSRCKVDFYCSQTCQTKDYKEGHKEQCPLKSLLSPNNETAPLETCFEQKVILQVSHWLMRRCGRGDGNKDDEPPLYRLAHQRLVDALVTVDDGTSVASLYRMALYIARETMLGVSPPQTEGSQPEYVAVTERNWTSFKAWFILKEQSYGFHLHKQPGKKWTLTISAVSEADYQ